MQCEFERARVYFEECLALKKELGDLNGIAFCFYCLGSAISSYSATSDPLPDERARALFEESLEIFHRINSKGEGLPIKALGDLYWRRGNYTKAAEYFRGANNLFALGWLALSQGEIKRAAELFNRLITFGQRRDKKGIIANALIALGDLAWEIGDLDQSIQHYAEAQRISRELGQIAYEVVILFGTGRVRLAWDDYASARVCFKEVLESNWFTETLDFVNYLEASAFLSAKEKEESQWH